MTKPRPKGATEPLIAALLARLPSPGEPWDAAARTAWLRMLAGGFDVVYGPVSPIAIGASAAIAADELPNPLSIRPPPPSPKPKAVERTPHQANGCDFYVDPDGHVRCDHDSSSGVPVPTPNRRVMPEEVMGEPVYEYRGARRDRETMIWADDSTGAAPGMEICGPG